MIPKNGNLAEHAVLYISMHKPKSFIIENVDAMVSVFEDYFGAMVAMLKDINDGNGNPVYQLQWEVVNTSTHGGLPQNRARMYLVGIRRDCMVAPFEWPCQIPMKRLSQVLDDHKGAHDLEEQVRGMSATKTQAILQGLEKILTRFGRVDDVEAIIDIGGSKGQPMYDCCPCLTKSRSGDSAFWSVRRRRVLTLTEMTRMQGASPDYFAGWEEHMHPRAMGNIIGNAMTQSIVERIMRQMFIAMGWAVKPDRWV